MMELEQAKEIVRYLAEGYNPTTGEVLPEDSVYNDPETIRALYTVLMAVEGKNVARDRAKRVEAEQAEGLLSRNGNPWFPEEERDLQNEFENGMKFTDIAQRHGRTIGAIKSRLQRLGLIEK